MRYFVKTICFILAICTIIGSFVLPSSATEPVPTTSAPAIQDLIESAALGTIKPVSSNIQPDSDTILSAEDVSDDTTTVPDDNSRSVNPSAPDDGSNIYSEVPLYFQNDYPDTSYGHGTVSSSGCGITCLAMVASYLTDTEYLPDALADRFGSYTASNLERMEYASNSLEIPAYDKVYDWDQAVDALGNGKVVIALMSQDSIFTDSQHFIVLTGLSADGKVFVNDPYKPNYSKSSLKKGFEEGFPLNEMYPGFTGGWAYLKDISEEDISDEPPKEASGTNKTVTEILYDFGYDFHAKNKDVHEKTLTNFDAVPNFYQNNYPNTRYGSGTIASSGCSMTSLAMVATYLTEHEYSPIDMVECIAEFNGESHIARLEYASTFLQLPWERAENFHAAMDALRQGKVVIALMEGTSLFTTGQHFIVLTGLNEDGKIMVNDPNEANYSVWNLKNAFGRGFSEGDILYGFSGAWIYDKSAMPEEPFIYEKEEVYIEPRYPEFTITAEEVALLARIIWLEARGESFEGQQAIAEIVFNRMASGDFPDTVTGVIFAQGQFPTTAFLDTAEPYSTQFEAIEKALYGPYVLPIDVFHFARTPVNDNIWGRIGGHVFCYQET